MGGEGDGLHGLRLTTYSSKASKYSKHCGRYKDKKYASCERRSQVEAVNKSL